MLKDRMRLVMCSLSIVAVAAILSSPAMTMLARPQQQGQPAVASASTADVDREIRDFLTREVTAHVADVKSLNPPQERVVGALTTGDFSWGTFMRALAEYSDLT